MILYYDYGVLIFIITALGYLIKRTVLKPIAF